MNYAFGSKTDSIKNNAPFMVDYMQRERVTNAIAQAKNVSDCIIFLAHWGNLDNAVPTEYQNQWAQFLLQQGVKVLIGSHPLVLQPCQMLSDGNGNEMLVYYSLGSLVSGALSAPELMGGLAEFTLEKTTVGEQTSVKITSNNLTPTVMHYSENMNICNVYPLSAYTDDLAKSHGVLAVDYYSEAAMTVAGFQNLFDYIMKIPVEASGNSNLLDYTFNPDSTLSGVDGSIIYPGEIAAANEADGSLDSLCGSCPVKILWKTPRKTRAYMTTEWAIKNFRLNRYRTLFGLFYLSEMGFIKAAQIASWRFFLSHPPPDHRRRLLSSPALLRCRAGSGKNCAFLCWAPETDTGCPSPGPAAPEAHTPPLPLIFSI